MVSEQVMGALGLSLDTLANCFSVTGSVAFGTFLFDFDCLEVTLGVREDGFELLRIPMREVPARLAELDPARPIACLCHHGMRSLQVANYLTQNGFTEVVNLQGGIDAWSQEVDPSVPCY